VENRKCSKPPISNVLLICYITNEFMELGYGDAGPCASISQAM